MKYIEKHPMIAIVVGVIGISLSAIFVRYSTAPSVVTAAYRLLWTVLLMSPVMLGSKKYRKEMRQVEKKTLIYCALSGICLALHLALWFESLKFTTVASSTTIVCGEVVWVAIGFCIFMHGRMNGKEVVAIIITLLGNFLIAGADFGLGKMQLYGDILALLAAMVEAAYTLFGRSVRSNTSTMTYTYLVYIFSTITLAVITLVQRQPLTGYGASGIVVGLLLAVFSTLLGHSIFSWCLKYFSPAFVSVTKLCEPVVAAIFAVFLFDEIPGFLQMIGSIIILGGVLFYSRVEASKEEDIAKKKQLKEEVEPTKVGGL